MDEMKDQETPAGEEVSEETSQAPASEQEEQCCRPCRGRGHCSLFGGIITGVIVGHLAALLLAPVKGERRGRWGIPRGGHWESRASLEEEGRLRAQVAVERVQAVAGGVTSSVTGVWATLRERLRDAVEEGKEGMAEGQEDARQRYEFMTKRHRPRR
jgi:gas vesicle protein